MFVRKLIREFHPKFYSTHPSQVWRGGYCRWTVSATQLRHAKRKKLKKDWWGPIDIAKSLMRSTNANAFCVLSRPRRTFFFFQDSLGPPTTQNVLEFLSFVSVYEPDQHHLQPWSCPSSALVQQVLNPRPSDQQATRMHAWLLNHWCDIWRNVRALI